MKSVTPADLGARLGTLGEDQEFKELITSYNTMLERLERSFHQASRFSADAAHELKTPLTVLRGRIEGLRRKTQDSQMHAQLSELLDEVSRLAAITRKLLLLSQADAGKLELQSEEVDVTKLLQELMEDAQMACENRVLQFDIADSLRTQGDVVLLRQLFNNLISNALRFAPEHGQVSLHAYAIDNAVEVQVSNSCSPISQATRARFFERFFRGEDSQSRKIEGSGLGLCLALEIARAHHGTLSLMPSADTEVVMLVHLPLR
jgi:signal transduction histidine kinase